MQCFVKVTTSQVVIVLLLFVCFVVILLCYYLKRLKSHNSYDVFHNSCRGKLLFML